MRRWLMVYQVAAGLSDTGTGLALLFAPRLTMSLLHLEVVPAPIAFMSFIGAFVCGVGVSYLWVALRCAAAPNRWSGQWLTTAIVRMSVAVFLLLSIAMHTMEAGWLFTAVFDGLLAAVQFTGLWRGWLARP